MGNDFNSVTAKVLAIFREIAPGRADRLEPSRPAAEAMEKLAEGLVANNQAEVAADVAFHLADWNWDAAFLVAVHLFPERFTADEVSAGVRLLMEHAPNHLAAAALLAGHPIVDAIRVTSPDESA